MPMKIATSGPTTIDLTPVTIDSASGDEIQLEISELSSQQCLNTGFTYHNGCSLSVVIKDLLYPISLWSTRLTVSLALPDLTGASPEFPSSPLASLATLSHLSHWLFYDNKVHSRCLHALWRVPQVQTNTSRGK